MTRRKMTTADIRGVVEALRASPDCFTGDRYWMDIHPSWLETPERRGQLWEMFARIAELEEA